MSAEHIILTESSGRYVNRTLIAISVGLDANANPTLVAGTDAETLIYSTALGAARSVTCSNTSAWKGAKFRIVRTDTAAFTLDVKDGSAATLKQIASTVAAFVDVVFDGTAWKLTAYGAL